MIQTASASKVMGHADEAKPAREQMSERATINRLVFLAMAE